MLFKPFNLFSHQNLFVNPTFINSMSSTDKNKTDNPTVSISKSNNTAAARKEASADKEIIQLKSKKLKQSGAKDGQTKISAAEPQKRISSLSKTTKGSVSIEPARTMSQSQINSQTVAMSLKKRTMAPSKKGSLSRVSRAYDDGERRTESTKRTLETNKKGHVEEIAKKKTTNMLKPMGSLFQSQKDETEDCFPQICPSDIMVQGNLSTKVDERAALDRSRVLNQDLDLLTPVTPKQGELKKHEITRGRQNSQGQRSKPHENESATIVDDVKCAVQPSAPLVGGRKPTMVKLKNMKGQNQTKDDVTASVEIEAQPSSKGSQSKAKRQTCPFASQQAVDVEKQATIQELGPIELQTPRDKMIKNAADDIDQEVQLEVDDDSQSGKGSKRSKSSDSSSGEQVVSDDSEEEAPNPTESKDETDNKKEQDNLQEMQRFAEQNGFKIEFEKKKKDEDIMDLYARAANFKITKELLDEQEKIDRQRFLKRMYVPPPLELLKKKYTNKEPIRTGFNQGLLPIHVKNNFEVKRAPQGPQIVITTTSQSFMERQRRQRELSIGSRDRSSRRSNRSVSRDSSRREFDTKLREGSRGQSNMRQAEVLSSRDSALKAQIGTDNEEEAVQVREIIQANPCNTEASLRHLFYLEYKKKFAESLSNPIVYSRFGKSSYNSDEKFDSENFNQLVRTCDLKKLLKLQDCNNLLFKKERKYSEPVSFPRGDYYTPKGPSDRTLVFESRFESGNLQLAHKVSDNEYDLVLQNDINSKGHTQWFYFRVSNVRKGLKVKFNMLNMIKPKSLYNDGMKVLIYSEKRQQAAAETEGGVEAEGGWHRGGEDLGYFQNNYKKEHQTNFQRYYFTFTFTHTFEHDEDQVYFAYSLPYTYTDLTNHLCEIESRQLNYVTRNTLCRTIAGNKCEYLTITNRVPFEVDKQKEGVVFTARIHPGESNSSLMMKGIIDFLVSSDPKAHELREKFVFKIIPMLNPDGVINGNYRCSLAGCDLNRRWKYPSEILHPTIYHTKKLISRLANERPLALYCDLHGHSRRKNIFMYGNNHEDNPKATRIFPFLMSKIAQPHFSYDYSRFSYCRLKEQTGRIAVWRDLGSKNPNIFTMEASFCGPKSVKYEPHRGNKRAPAPSELNYHFISKDYADIGQSLCETLLTYRQEKDANMGLLNIEYQIDQYHLEKEAKIEQEDLIRQQQVIVDHRKQQEAHNRQRATETLGGQNHHGEDGVVAQAKPEKTTLDLLGDTLGSASKRETLTAEKKEVGKSTRKAVKKAKTESLVVDNAVVKGGVGNLESDLNDEEDKKKAKYNLRDRADESDAQSDSEPSEDNLEEDQISKLIPKKWGKKRFLKGVDEKKKKVKQETEKKPEKKPKAMLMPCMSHKKNEVMKDQKRENSESVTKKIRVISNSISKTVASRFRNGAFVRDIATQIKYKGDGKGLSLMELDILNTTGCKWSRIIYPGYKGPKIETEKVVEQAAGEEDKDDNNQKACSNFLLNTVSVSNLRTPVSKFNSELYNSLATDGLRDESKTSCSIKAFNLSKQNRSVLTNEKIKNSLQAEPAVSRSKNSSQVTNERRSSQGGSQVSSSIPAASEIAPSNQIDKLKKRIMEGNFSEPKSLFNGMDLGSASSMKNKLRQHAFDYSTKKMFSDSKNSSKIDQTNIYDLNLETVQERVNDKSCLTLDVSDLACKGKERNLSYNNYGQYPTKRIVNGEVQPHSGGLREGSSLTKAHLAGKLGNFIGDGLRVRNNGGSYDSNQLLHSSASSKKHRSMMYGSHSRMSKGPVDNQPQLSGKLSFSNVAHQILSNNSSCEKKKSSSNAPQGTLVFDEFGKLQQHEQNYLAGRNGSVSYANYKSAQQAGKKRHSSMFKDQQMDIYSCSLANQSQLTMLGSGLDGHQMMPSLVGNHLTNPPAIIGGASISQLSAGISIKNFNENRNIESQYRGLQTKKASYQ